VKGNITIGFSPHRVETLPFAEKLMNQHDIIILEEPPNTLFYKVLEEKISLEEYVKNTEFWFPGFTKESLKILRKFYKSGKKIFQIEPYLEKVALIQKELEEGKEIGEIIEDPELKEIRIALRKANGILKSYILGATSWYKCPNFTFIKDDDLEKNMRMDELFAQISKKDKE